MKRMKSALLGSLLPRTTQFALAATVLRPQKEWYLSELAEHLGIAPSSLQRLLPRLAKAGILLRRVDGNRIYYRADKACPIYAELSLILTKTVGIADPLRSALKTLGAEVHLAFVHGSIISATERTESDIDLIVIGTISGLELSRVLKPLDRMLGRQVNPTWYTAEEFRQKLGAKNHFLSAILKKPRIYVIGDEHTLEQITG